MYSKAQLKIQEMAFILVAIVFLFSLVFLFFARFQYAQMQEQAKVLREYRTVQLLHVVAGLPELQCPLQRSGSPVSVCIDKDKAKQFSQDEALRESFSELWKNSNIVEIKVEEIWPEKDEYLIYSREGKNIVVYATYVPLCSQSCVIGKIKIAVERP